MSTQDPLSWVKIGTSKDDLLKELLELYWEGLEGEIADAILSLNNIFRLQKKYPEAGIGPQAIEHRVSARLGPPIFEWDPLKLDWEQRMECITEAGEFSWDQQNVEEDYLMARMMLSGLNMLDFDEIIEYRDPPLPSQRGPPRCLAVKSSVGDSIEIMVLECDICHEPLRGLAWTCRLGCKSNVESQVNVENSFDVCAKCYNEGKHPIQHLIRSPHRYGISGALQSELSPEDFWLIRREIQRKQYEIDRQLDRSKGGIINSMVVHALTDWSRTVFPVGNVHAGVMFGPLIFEIGVKDSKNGARISCRQPPELGKRWKSPRLEKVLALDPNRVLYKASGTFPSRPIQATVKQVVGGMFSGYHQHLQQLEDLVVKMLLSAARKWTEKPLKSRQANYSTLRGFAKIIITPFRFVMDGYLMPYLKAITEVIFDQNTELRWSQYTNNCQTFCDAIIPQPMSPTIFPPTTQMYSLRTDRKDALLDYVLSFRTDPQLGNALTSSKLSIGPLSAYLKLLHRQTNVLEYQESQGRGTTNNTPLCAQIFAWNCQDQNECDLADHMWTNPAEFLSIIQFQLMLDNSHYFQASANEGNPAPLDEVQWVKSRLFILQANNSFASAAAGIATTFQNRLKRYRSRSWNPPKPPSVPQDIPFMMADDVVQYAQEDPGTNSSLLGGWISRSNRTDVMVELPKAYGPNATATVVSALDQAEA